MNLITILLEIRETGILSDRSMKNTVKKENA
jgi:hypothetical protein